MTQKYSREWFYARPCLPNCAGCCPSTPPHRCDHLTEDLKCDVHPLVLGVTEAQAERHGRHWACHYSPWVLFTYTHDCLAITDVLRDDFGIDVQSHTNNEGQGVVDNLGDVMVEVKKIWVKYP